jgi:hypothetical protein
MHVALTGSHGLIGTALTASLEADGHQVTAITRGASPAGAGATATWDPEAGTIDTTALTGVDAVVHLAGEGIASHRWTPEQKHRIRDSRVKATSLLAHTLAELDDGPGVLVSGSAIGYYGSHRGDELLDEASSEGPDFLAAVCGLWEDATRPAADAGVRVATIRSGIVLSGKGGALAKQLVPFKLGLGGPVGRGGRWTSWISLTDEVAAIRYLLDHPVSGPVNLTAPNPVTNADFTHALGRALHRPTVVPIPTFVRHVPFGVGELADNLLLASQRVTPKVLLGAGFTFEHPVLDEALSAEL